MKTMIDRQPVKIKGMGVHGPECPECHQRSSSVIDSRPVKDGTHKRRRQCQCGNRFTTYEITAIKAGLDYQI